VRAGERDRAPGRRGRAGWIDDQARIAHAKAMVIDGATTLQGSYNWTRGAAENSEDLNLISSPTVAVAYSGHWRQRLAVSVRFARREDWCRISSAEARRSKHIGR
jgi:phosphatidylserine/phosphatidylglycerophosphate/cardiolipin synthase-like enzyme